MVLWIGPVVALGMLDHVSGVVRNERKAGFSW